MEKNKVNEKVISTLKGLVNFKDIIMIYYCGSIAYQTYEENNSDIDVTVVLENYNGYNHVNIDDIDFFIFGVEYFYQRQNFTKEIPEYYKAFSDDILSIKNTLIYFDEQKRDKYIHIRDYDISKNLVNYLESIINFYDDFVSVDSFFDRKRLYHILRIDFILKRFEETKVFSLNLNNKIKETILKFKHNYNNDVGNQMLVSEIIPAFSRIKNYYERLKGGSTNE